MDVDVTVGRSEAGELVADMIEGLLLREPSAVLGLAAGDSPLPVYDALIRRHQAGGVVRLGQHFAAGTDDHAASRVGVGGVRAAAVHAEDVRLIFDGTCAQERHPVIRACRRPVRDHQKQLGGLQARW